MIRILHLEDDPLDRELARATLEAGGLHCDIHCVATRLAFESALVAGGFTIVLADYNLPDFDGLTAQAITRRLAPNTAFIFLSGTLGEEVAVERIRDGASDYVLKQRIGRLPAAVERATREHEERIARQRAEQQMRDRETALRESERWLEAILDHSPHAIYVKDVRGRYLVVNRRLEELAGRRRDGLLGRSDHEVWPALMADQYVAHDQQVIAGRRAMEFDEPALMDDGVHVMTSVKFPLFDASSVLYATCGFSADVTRQKKTEDDLRLARLEADRASRAKNEFLSHMSHDLRTPLNAILGFAQLLAADDLGEERNDNVQQILGGGHHLLHLINGVLDIARIESGHLSLSPEFVDLHEIVERTAALMRPLAAQRGIDIRIEPPAEALGVFADRQRLGQILINLLGNAVKYNREHGTVTIRWMTVTSTRCRVLVRDTGTGLRPEQVRMLFQPFERLGAERSEVEGSGLGLALSRSLAEAMGGSMGAESAIDVGSTFWVELDTASAPCGRASASAQPPESSLADIERRGEPATIVYVEDNGANVRLMERVLKRRPHIHLIHAPTAEAGLAAIRAHRPDVILLDLHLPDLSGEEVLRQLWSDAATRTIPTVMVTAEASQHAARRLRASGAVACITKPIDIGEVLGLVDRLLESASSARAAERRKVG